MVGETLMRGLRILSGNRNKHGGDPSEIRDRSTEAINEPPNTQREENIKTRQSSNRLGWYGKR